MNRRDLLKTAVAAGIATGAGRNRADAQSRPNYIVMEWFHSRNDFDTQRLREYLSTGYVGAFGRAGIKPVGLFQTSVGPLSPSILVVCQFPSLAAMEEARQKVGGDQKFWEEMAAFDDKAEPAYERREAWLLEAFRGFPAIEVPKVEPGKTNLFELRIYESRTGSAHMKKVSMFNNGEIDIFRRCGINPVFFGSTIFGPRSPNLVYMACFPSWQARDAAWGKFREDPEWKKMSTDPKYSGRDLVTVISNQLMTPLPASQVL
jgi:hypothetical protein